MASSFEGKRHDAGDKLGFLKATVEYALQREDLGPAFKEYLLAPGHREGFARAGVLKEAEPQIAGTRIQAGAVTYPPRKGI